MPGPGKLTDTNDSSLTLRFVKCLWAKKVMGISVGYQISIIGDDRSVREAVKSLIRSLGYDAVTFASAEEYLGSDGTHDSECIITDIQMPGMTGIALQNQLIADGYRRPIILMSALSAEETGAWALGTAASSFLKKPFSDERLIDCLDQALKDPAAK
jgi:FixJ family two-component response regulator